MLPVKAAPAHVGKVEWPGGDKATFRAEPGVLWMYGKQVSEIDLSKPATFKIGDMTLHAGIYNGALRIDVQDANAATRKHAKAPIWFFN